ncbi:methionyl-tRNA formyltransferase [Candidatus Persebacteraceae bacterium Df01]|jgi:methionyl-tRNA formyltransferase|uniref:Methionyl-tRNA formyltransferase n=1 Tax=Candidatus Doriopsillibacter californiensis TaxID=2970740 RepID=A0ABT7QMX1_9GAMM|nr:methionyl-tRNA formyltransferase [Candidatus Persebacteraceae bacterium Df01]
MKLIFFGAGSFAIPALQALVNIHDICLVICPPPKPVGRNMQQKSCPLAQVAQTLALPLIENTEVATIRSDIRQQQADALVVCDYGHLLPTDMLTLTPRGALNIHSSLLPRWRGAAPILRALLAGDNETGVTIMQMDAGLDSGKILLQQKTPIMPTTTGSELHDTLAMIGAQLIIQVLSENPTAVAQDDSQATYAKKITNVDRQLNFNQPAIAAWRQVRAFAPQPCAYTVLADKHIKVRTATVRNVQGTPGEILSISSDGIVIACANNALALLEVQRAGKRFITAADFLRGFKLPIQKTASII